MLVAMFHPDPALFGSFREVAAADVPPETRRLLDHESHMTVAMDRFHGGPVALRVVAVAPTVARNADRYAREILLLTPGGRVVQHGIVTVDLGALDAASAASIREAQTPLGRVLINSSLLCRVQNVRLLEVLPGPHLRALFAAGGAPNATRLYGRVAEIVLQGRQAVDLLEIAGPLPSV
jgi:chorismate-pyruvate lyase